MQKRTGCGVPRTGFGAKYRADMRPAFAFARQDCSGSEQDESESRHARLFTNSSPEPFSVPFVVDTLATVLPLECDLVP